MSQCFTVMESLATVLDCMGNLSTAIFDVAINGGDQLLVADKRNHCIYIGTKGSDRGQLFYPSGVAVDIYTALFL